MLTHEFVNPFLNAGKLDPILNGPPFLVFHSHFYVISHISSALTKKRNLASPENKA